MSKKTFVIAGGTKGVAKQVVIELVKIGYNVVFGDIVEPGNFLIDTSAYFYTNNFFRLTGHIWDWLG
jgi:NAD(P)-dependent dehydrogenase (short-subunit alcohol dehydrogenase family)